MILVSHDKKASFVPAYNWQTGQPAVQSNLISELIIPHLNESNRQ